MVQVEKSEIHEDRNNCREIVRCSPTDRSIYQEDGEKGENGGVCVREGAYPHPSSCEVGSKKSENNILRNRYNKVHGSKSIGEIADRN